MDFLNNSTTLLFVLMYKTDGTNLINQNLNVHLQIVIFNRVLIIWVKILFLLFDFSVCKSVITSDPSLQGNCDGRSSVCYRQ